MEQKLWLLHRRASGEIIRNREVKIEFESMMLEHCRLRERERWIQIKTYRCPINEIFSALFIERCLNWGEDLAPETSQTSPNLDSRTAEL